MGKSGEKKEEKNKVKMASQRERQKKNHRKYLHAIWIY